MTLPGIGDASSALTAGPYEVVEEREVSQARWDAWLEGSPGGGHVLQSHGWGEFKRGLGWRPVRLTLRRGGRVVGLASF